MLPVDVFGQDIEARFDFNGTLALQGIPVLHAGTPSFLPMDQARIHAALATLREHAVIATVCDGLVTDLVPTHSHCVPAAHMLEAMFAVDSRYRSLLEIGFGMNTTLTPFPGNAAMNEVYGGTHGVVHFLATPIAKSSMAAVGTLSTPIWLALYFARMASWRAMTTSRPIRQS